MTHLEGNSVVTFEIPFEEDCKVDCLQSRHLSEQLALSREVSLNLFSGTRERGRDAGFAGVSPMKTGYGWGRNRTDTRGILSPVSHNGKLFALAAVIQPSAAALEAGLIEQEQRYPYSAVLP